MLQVYDQSDKMLAAEVHRMTEAFISPAVCCLLHTAILSIKTYIHCWSCLQFIWGWLHQRNKDLVWLDHRVIISWSAWGRPSKLFSPPSSVKLQIAMLMKQCDILLQIFHCIALLCILYYYFLKFFVLLLLFLWIKIDAMLKIKLTSQHLGWLLDAICIRPRIDQQCLMNNKNNILRLQFLYHCSTRRTEILYIYVLVGAAFCIDSNRTAQSPIC